MGGQSILGQSRVLEEECSASPHAWPGSLKGFVSDEKPILCVCFLKFTEFFFLLKMKIALLSSTEMIYSFTI